MSLKVRRARVGLAAKCRSGNSSCDLRWKYVALRELLMQDDKVESLDDRDDSKLGSLQDERGRWLLWKLQD